MSERPRRYAASGGDAYAGAPLTKIGDTPLRPGAFERYLRFAHSQLLALAESDVQAIHRKRRDGRRAAARSRSTGQGR
ncbi:hypothetical protein [Solimonas soli]|uniref:hypothetical protein n=1 Tax=Solimonas soli TaxID=413479 RepID=UPI00047FC762|nr:hypothetical protein [Solimonas soli]